MTEPAIAGVAPFFIVADVPRALSFYRDMLGFDITFRGPSPEDEFFGIVRRGAAMVMFKALDVEPFPNYRRKPSFSWDAYFDVPACASRARRLTRACCCRSGAAPQ